MKDVIRLAGGFNSEVMAGTKIELSTIDRKASKRVLRSLDLTTDSDFLISDGDVINISSTHGLKPQTIKLTGELKNPGEYSIQPWDTIFDIINRAGGYTDQAYTEGGLYLRESVAESQKKAFLRSAEELENTIIDIITKGSIENITEFTLSPITILIKRLREELRNSLIQEILLLKITSFSFYQKV